MMENSYKDLSKFYGSNSNIMSQSNDNINDIFQLDLEPISDSNHYLYPKCLKFPFIKFCKDRKNIRWTCSCMNNKKILIKDLFDNTNNFAIEDSFISLNIENKNNDKNYENELICKEHRKEYKYFSKYFLENYCEDCKFNENDIIRFEDIKIEEKKSIYYLK